MFHVKRDIRHRESPEVPTALTQVKSHARTRQWVLGPTPQSHASFGTG
jgi:hypothetical protein